MGGVKGACGLAVCRAGVQRQIGDGLRYQRDETLWEDRYPLQMGHAVRVMAAINNLVRVFKMSRRRGEAFDRHRLALV